MVNFPTAGDQLDIGKSLPKGMISAVKLDILV